MGALEYEPADKESDLYGEVELDSLSGEVDRILDGAESSVLDELLKLNGSSGGARPKIVAYVSPDRKHIVHGGQDIPDGYTSWIIKFSERHDPQTSGELKDSVEGKVKWMTLPEMLARKLAPNMTKYLAVFQNETIPQAYGISEQGLNLVDNNAKLTDTKSM